MFKNFSLLRIDLKETPASLLEADAFAEQLAKAAFKPIGNQDMIAVGWSDYWGDQAGGLVRAQGDHLLLTLRVDERTLPGSVIKCEVEKAAEKLAAEQGFPAGRKQLRELKHLVRERLIPKALVSEKKRLIHVWLDTREGWLVAESKADLVAQMLHQVVDGLKLAMPETKTSPSSLMANWIVDDAPETFTVDDECALKAIDETRSVVAYTRQNLDRKDVREHIQEGKLPVKLALTYEDKTSFILTDKLEFKRVTQLAIDDSQGQDDLDREALVDAEFALVTGACRPVIREVMAALN